MYLQQTVENNFGDAALVNVPSLEKYLCSTLPDPSWYDQDP